MKLISSASHGKGNPMWLEKGRCILFTFDTGHKLRVWGDGTRDYESPRKRQINHSRHAATKAAMDAAAANLHPK
jgi:hypothetical protein